MTAGPVTDKDKESQEEEDPTIPKPPDGGWGWVVVFASFMVHVIADGVAYSFGVYVESFIEYFECTHGEIGLLGSLMLGVTWGTGPVASVLTNRFGCRIVTIMGTTVAAFGFIISVLFAEVVRDNVYLMYLTFGIIAGFGLGLAYLPAIVSVSYYFEKRRSFATGLAVCGSGLGTFIFAPLTEALVEEYGWKGTVLIETGLLLNCFLCGAVMRPLRAKRRSVKAKQLDQIELLEVNKLPDAAEQNINNGNSNQPGAIAILNKSNKSPHTGSHKDIATHNGINSDSRMTRSDNHVNQAGATVEQKSTTEEIGPLDRIDAFYTRSIDRLPEYQEDPLGYKRSVLSIPKPEKEEEEEEHCSLLKRCGVSRKTRRNLHNMMDLTLLASIVFQLFGWSNLLTSIGFCVPYIYLPDRGRSMGFDKKQAAFLVSLVGISNTIGRIVFGFIADFKCVNRLMLYNTVLFLCGLTSIASSLCVTYPLMSTYAFSFGLFIGVYTCLTPIVLVDLLGLAKLSNAFGLVLLYQGFGAVIGPPIAGGLYDAYKNYDYSFYMMGACVAVSGAMLYPILCMRKPSDKEKEEKEAKALSNSAPQPLVEEHVPEIRT